MRYGKLLLAVVLIMSALASPAAAKNDAGAFIGTATIGEDFLASDPCDNDGDGVPFGKGLYLPTLNDHNAVYALSAGVTSVVNGLGDFDVCGYLTSVAGIGAACGWSKGYDGQGKASWPAKAGVWYDINDVEWKFAPGGTIYVTASVVEDVAGTKTGTGKTPGTLYAVVQASVSDAECADPKPLPGENDIDVAGVYTIVQGGTSGDQNAITDPIDPKDDGPSSPTNPWGDKK